MGEPTFWMKIRDAYRQIVRWCLCTVGQHITVLDTNSLQSKYTCIWCEKEVRK